MASQDYTIFRTVETDSEWEALCKKHAEQKDGKLSFLDDGTVYFGPDEKQLADAKVQLERIQKECGAGDAKDAKKANSVNDAISSVFLRIAKSVITAESRTWLHRLLVDGTFASGRTLERLAMAIKISEIEAKAMATGRQLVFAENKEARVDAIYGRIFPIIRVSDDEKNVPVESWRRAGVAAGLDNAEEIKLPICRDARPHDHVSMFVLTEAETKRQIALQHITEDDIKAVPRTFLSVINNQTMTFFCTAHDAIRASRQRTDNTPPNHFIEQAFDHARASMLLVGNVFSSLAHMEHPPISLIRALLSLEWIFNKTAMSMASAISFEARDQRRVAILEKRKEMLRLQSAQLPTEAEVTRLAELLSKQSAAAKA